MKKETAIHAARWLRENSDVQIALETSDKYLATSRGNGDLYHIAGLCISGNAKTIFDKTSPPEKVAQAVNNIHQISKKVSKTFSLSGFGVDFNSSIVQAEAMQREEERK